MRRLENGECVWHESLGTNTNIFSIACVDTGGSSNCPVVAICGWDGSTFLFDKEQNLVRFKFEGGDVAAFQACILNRKDNATGKMMMEICLVYVTLDSQIFMYTIDDGYFANGVGVDSLIDLMDVTERASILQFVQELKNQKFRNNNDNNSSNANGIRKNLGANTVDISTLVDKASEEQLFAAVVSAIVQVAGEEMVHGSLIKKQEKKVEGGGEKA